MDTNVLVRALITPRSTSHELLKVVLRGRDAGLTVLYDTRILDEYREVLERPQFKLNPKRVRRVVRRLQWLVKGSRCGVA